jgi:AAA domain
MKINAVFTPRNPDVNIGMYIPRLDLEKSLQRSVEGSMHSLIFGESGNGKSWLYKKVFEQNGILYAVANCANASRLNSLTSEICSVLIPPGTSSKTGFTENKEATIKALIADGKLIHQDQYEFTQQEPLLQAFQVFRKKIGDGIAVLVLDNLESIFENTELMSELADILILLDDSRYAKFKLKIVIVGVPNGVLEYFAKTKNMSSVANRIEEIRKVEGLNLSMVGTLIERGFNNLLKFQLPEQSLREISKHAYYVTMGVAQRVHEYCEKLAHQIEDNNRIYNDELLEKADADWLMVGMRQAYTVIESHLNSRRTAIARRNQVIYSIGQLSCHQFDTSIIIDRLKQDFPETTPDTNMGIGGILSELASGDNPLLKKNPRTSDYRVVDPRYTMCIRAALRIDPVSNQVYKRYFKN